MAVILSPTRWTFTNTDQFNKENNPANTFRKSNVTLRLYFGNLRQLLSANINGAWS